MKLYNVLLIVGMMMVSFATFGQKNDVVTCEFKVSGVCGMCKERIEEAAYIKGVKYVEWTIETGTAKVVYKTDKVDELDIHKAIAAVGHDTELVEADSLAYTQLPQCCAYDNGVKVH